MMETQAQSNQDEARATRGVDVAGLEKQLAVMWRETAKGGDAGVTRVCVANLVVYVPGREERAGLEELLEEVAQQTPSRVILLFAERDSESRLDAYVSSSCHEPQKGRRQVCCEQVTIEAGGASVASVASAVEPLLIADIPAFLWWKDIPPDDDKLFTRLVKMSDRVVIDSAAFDHPHADLSRVARLVAERADVLMLSDLNWGRLTAWRNLVASFWDVPDYRAHLDALDSILIEYTPSASVPEEITAQALLVAGWLASRLGWQPTDEKLTRDENGFRITLEAGARTINLEFRALSEGAEGALRRVVLRSAGGAAEFYAMLDGSGTRLETSAKIGDALSVGRVLGYEAKSEGRRLSREMSILARDEIYEQAVAVAAKLIAPLVAVA